jgi:diguanylate cyclase (GGDEF)-like protein
VLSTLCALALLVYDHDHTLNPLAIVLCTGTIVCALLRLVVTFREAHSLADSRRLALTDELTGLGNRRAFYEALAQRLAGDESGALLLLDLDRFKEVNDSLGHHAGDTLLQQLTARLTTSLRRSEDLLVRLGGDELALLVAGADGAAALNVAAHVRDVLAPPFQLEGVTVRVSASVGIALYPEHGDAPSQLLRRADVAMYQAKASTTSSGAVLYDAGTDEFQNRQRLRDIELLRQTVTARELVLHYQPKLNATTGGVTGVEALVRWDHPERGLLMPAAFLPLVEDSGLMHELTEAVLEQSLDQVAAWRDAGRLLSVAVNLSASSLVDVELPRRVQVALSARRLGSEVLELEITEDFLMADRERARDILVELRALGVRIAVDDFGTGYSSLSYLRELPIDELKLDRSFVQPMAGDERAAAIVRSTIGLAHSLGMTMVAEGVEDENTADQLAGSDCDTLQGFYYSQALPAAQLESWVDRWHALVGPASPPLRLAASAGGEA